MSASSPFEMVSSIPDWPGNEIPSHFFQTFDREYATKGRGGEIPLLATNFPDPSYCHGYLFGTDDHKKKIRIQVAKLTQNGWALEKRDALSRVPAGVDEHSVCWAPSVIPIYRTPGEVDSYVMLMCLDMRDPRTLDAKTRADFSRVQMGIFSAHAKSLDQPFIPDDTGPLTCSFSDMYDYEHIDPSGKAVYIQSASGKLVATHIEVVFGSMAGKPVKRALLPIENGKVLPAVSIETVCYPPSDVLYEAPEEVAFGPRIEGFVSEGNTWGTDSYRVINPWRRVGESVVPHAQPRVLIEGRFTDRDGLSFMNPGHQHVFSVDGRSFMFYHRSLVSDITVRMPFLCELEDHGDNIQVKR